MPSIVSILQPYVVTAARFPEPINFYDGTQLTLSSYLVFAGINCLLVLYVFFLIPETKGVPLEEMDKLFGGENHVQGGAEIIREEQVNFDHPKPESDHSSNHRDAPILSESKQREG